MKSTSINKRKKGILVALKTLFLISFFLAYTNCEPSAKIPVEKPNIILIMLDDLGYECIESYGGTTYKTPNINKLSASGMQFNQAYAQPLCTNTRVKLMTGKYNYRNWTSFGILDPNQKTFGHLMQDAGYSTCIVGKWQLQSYDPINYAGSEYRRGTGMKADDAGFDEYCLWHTGHTEDKGSRYVSPKIHQNGKFLQYNNEDYGPDIFSKYLNDYVSKKHNKPFFIYYPMVLTHDPFSPTPNSDIWKNPEKRSENNTSYYKHMVEYADKIVGDIINNLEKRGIRDNTLILLYSDNGTHQTIYSKKGKEIIQGGKGLTTDAGIRVPLIANWPAQLKENKTTDEFIDAIDFLPTILEAAGTKIPDNYFSDGESFLPLIKGETVNRRDWVYMSYNPKPGAGKDHLNPAEFVFNKKYKLYGDGRFYDIEKDKLELKPLDTTKFGNNKNQIKNRFTVIMDSLKKYPTYGWVERLDPGLDTIISKHARIDLVAEGFNWSEGPVWLPHKKTLLFTDVPENKVYQWNDIKGLSLYLEPSGYTGPQIDPWTRGGKGANGLSLDLQGNLILCQQGDRVISKLVSLKDSLNPEFKPIVTNYKGKKFNSPNDLTFDKEGNMYFTDPTYGLKNAKSDLGFSGLFFYPKDGGDVILLDKSIKFPNGVAISHDNKTLYIGDSNTEYPKIFAYDILSPGKISNRRLLFDVTELREKSISKQCPDGIKLDKHGNLFFAGPDGVLIITPEGKHLGTIRTDIAAGNCEFTDDGRYLFIVADDLLLRVNLRPYAKS
ncbi:sulfatase-like hydrolase/transferase [uncultured Algibacter sp.]|uniref:sulfatase-like hydrolase/transferase n=1 Tax=uncultured Algibacter sp. TaxID=298659 RepID=UPI00262B415B|nr:sulfatase-like hydrolase/transferase [uncultured Algibacter sp.]